MPSFNSVSLMGNVTRDPELRYTPKGIAVCRVSLAINRRYKLESGEERDEVTYVECDSFSRHAELLAKYVRKGSPLFLHGRLKLDQWADKTTGEKKTRLGVVVETFQFLGSKPESEAAGERPASVATAPEVEADGDKAPF